MVRKTIIVLTILVVSAVLTNIIVAGRNSEIDRTLKFIEETVLRLNAIDDNITANSKLVMSAEDDTLVHASLRSFKKTGEERMKEYKALEESIDSFGPALELTEELVSILGMLNSLHFTLETVMTYCADSGLYSGHKSNGTPLEESCSASTTRAISEELTMLYEDLDRKSLVLQRLDFWARLKMQTADSRPAPQPKGHGNIAIILIDALRADMVGCYGGPAHTPNIDKLASEGVMFREAVSPSSSTHTSVASLLTGMNPYIAGAIGTAKWQYDKSLVLDLQDAGYHTVAFSGNPVIHSKTEYHRGFTWFYGRHWAPANAMFENFRGHWKYMWHGEQPFFMYLHLIDPHDPYFSPDSLRDLIENGRPPGLQADPNKFRKEYTYNGMDPRDYVSPENIEYLKKLYIQEVEYADRQLGRFLDFMNDNGMMENTTVALIADHGETFLEHGDVKHSWQLFQESIHVPLIIRGDLPGGFAPGQVVEQPRSITELLASLMKKNGLPVPERAAAATHLFSADRDEMNLPVVSVTNGMSLDLSRMAMVEKNKAELMALRRGDLKVILDVKQEHHAYNNLKEDPGETAELDLQSEEALRMRDEALKLRAEYLSSQHKGQGGKWETMRKRLKDFGYLE